METTELVGGINIREVIEEGANFEIKYETPVQECDPEEQEYAVALQNYLKLECLDFGTSYDGAEPFSNVAKKMFNLEPNGKVKKRIIREGYGETPEESRIVNLHYNAYVQFEAEPFDSTYARQKIHSFTLGNGEVIEGLEIAVRSMKLNEKAQFLIAPELAYKNGLPGKVPPDSVVLFEIELYEVKNTVIKNIPDGEERKFQYVYPECLALSLKGKNLFRLKNYHGAIKEYSAGVNKLEDAILNNYEDQMKSEELLVRLYTNLLVCATQAKIPKRGCVFAQKIYQMARNKTFEVSAKVYFSHAKCQRMLGGFEQAERKLRQARQLEPNDPDIRKEWDLLNRIKEQSKTHEKKLGRALLTN